MVDIHIYFDHFPPGFWRFHAFYGMVKRRLNAIFRPEMSITLFFGGRL